jgi:hypothetical protein
MFSEPRMSWYRLRSFLNASIVRFRKSSTPWRFARSCTTHVLESFEVLPGERGGLRSRVGTGVYRARGVVDHDSAAIVH